MEAAAIFVGLALLISSASVECGKLSGEMRMLVVVSRSLS